MTSVVLDESRLRDSEDGAAHRERVLRVLALGFEARLALFPLERAIEASRMRISAAVLRLLDERERRSCPRLRFIVIRV